jgi:hypothetical protein
VLESDRASPGQSVSAPVPGLVVHFHADPLSPRAPPVSLA